MRSLTSATLVESLRNQRISHLSVRLSAVIDLRDIAALGLRPDQIFHETDGAIPQALAEAALLRGVEGILVPSATLLEGHNLVVFPEVVLPNRRIEVVRFEDPDLRRGAQ